MIFTTHLHYQDCLIISSSILFLISQSAFSQKTRVVLKTPPIRLSTEAEWMKASLDRHNYLRSLHGAQPLQLNRTLSEFSQSWANTLLEKTIQNYRLNPNPVPFFEHNKESNARHRMGENLYYSTHDPKVLGLHAEIAVKLWYEEIEFYDFEFARVKDGFPKNSMIGHFTQLVWNSTTQMGTAYATGVLPNGRGITFVNANYYPGGNLVYSDFPARAYIGNVFPLKGSKSSDDPLQTIRHRILIWEIPTKELTTPQSWIDSAISRHNDYRDHHGFPAIKESHELSKVAQYWANSRLNLALREFDLKWTIDGKPNLRNPGATERGQFGESVLFYLHSNWGEVDPVHTVTLWYEEHGFYDFRRMAPNFNKTANAGLRTKNFEQIVWKSTTHVGIAFSSGVAENSQVITFVVAYYYPKRPDGASLEARKANIPTSSSAVVEPVFVFSVVHIVLSIVPIILQL